jgi:hypothetical protein
VGGPCQELRRRSLILVLFLTLAGCASEQAEDAAPEEEEPTAEQGASLCESVRPWLKRAIASGLTVQGGGTLGKAAAVRSDDFEKVWYVSAVIRGPGLGTDTIGTWATNRDPSAAENPGLIIGADAIAREFSDWGAAASEDSPAGQVIGLDNHGAQESRDCLS